MTRDAFRDGKLVKTCEKCGKSYREIFDTIALIDYAEPGRGKPRRYHLCIDCRKALFAWFEEINEK